MMKKYIYLIVFFSVFFSVACNNKEEKPKIIQPKSELKDISSIEVNLPDAEGSEVFKANCMTCHSLRYIEMQPDFPQKTWTKIVDKMIKTFGAPINDSSAVKIVNYLVAIKGKH